MFKVYASLDDRIPLTEVATCARRAETMGYDGIIVLDGLHDGLVSASLALQATTRLKVLTVGLATLTRGPMVVAKSAWNLQSMSNGRFQLGLGEPVKTTQGRHNTSWGDDPSNQMREYIQCLRAIFDSFQNGTQLQIEGDFYQFDKLEPWMNPGSIPSGPPPIYLTAVGPDMIRLAGQFTDGVLIHPTHTIPEFIEEKIIPPFKEGMSLSELPNPEAGPLITTFVATGRDREAVLKHKEKRRNLMANMFSTPTYWEVLQYIHQLDVGQQLQECVEKKDWATMPTLVTDEILSQLIVYGTYSTIAEEIFRRYRGISDWVIFPLPESADDDEAASAVVSQLQHPTTNFRIKAVAPETNTGQFLRI